MDSIQQNKQFITNAVNSSEFTEKINEAAPFRVKIDVDYRREMKEVLEMFQKQMIESDVKLQTIMKKKRKDRDESEQAYLKEATKKMNDQFRAVKKVIHPNKGTPEKAAQKLVDRVAEVAKMLKYIGRNYIEDAFANAGFKVEVPNLEDENAHFAKNGSKEIMTDIFQQADEVQGCICQASDEIKIRIFGELPDTIKFDPKLNKQGIKKGGFQKLVKSKALILEKGSEGAEKFKKFQISRNENDIVSKQIEIEKQKDI